MEQLDIRFPLGLLFVILGLILAVQGIVAGPSPSAGYNINLVWGAVFALFGVLTLWLARRGAQP
jgi:hypothetical protein